MKENIIEVKMAQAPIDLAEKNRLCQVEDYTKIYEHNFEEVLICEEPLHTETEEENEQTEYNAICDICFLLNFSKIPALYICCKQYMCSKCFKGHGSHTFINVVSKESERDLQIKNYLDTMRNESEREKMFEKEEVSVLERVSVKHEYDIHDCDITRICELNNARWVISDKGNHCIKIFNSGSNILRRYIRLLAEPCGVTEIKVKREPIKQGVLTASESSKVSLTNRVERDKQCILAVTFPLSNRIVFIDLNSNPAIQTKSIETGRHCFSIEFSNDKMFIICRGKFSGPWFLTVMSTDGDILQTFNTDLYDGWYTHLAVCSGRVYITDRRLNKVFWLNKEGNVSQYHKEIKGSGPEGISIDPDSNKVYICSLHHDKLYRLDSGLKRFESLLDLESVKLAEPSALCFYRERLYVGHAPWSAHANFVTVVRVL